MSLSDLSTVVAHYGYLATFVSVLLASAGVPVPAGEILIAAAIYCANTHRLSLPILILAAALGAVGGGAVGFAIGRSAGAATLQRFGGRVGLGPARLRLGQYLFRVHGGKIVFALRFVALLGPFGGVLAGANRMGTARFMLFNLLGGVAWAVAFSVLAYLFGSFLQSAGKPAAIAASLLAVALVIGLLVWLHRRGTELQHKADAMFGVA